MKSLEFYNAGSVVIIAHFKEPKNYKGFEISTPTGRTGIIQLQALVSLTLEQKRNLI